MGRDPRKVSIAPLTLTLTCAGWVREVGHPVFSEPFSS